MNKMIKWHFSLMLKRPHFKISFTIMMLLSMLNNIYAVSGKYSGGFSRMVDKYFAYPFFNGNPFLALLYIIIPIIITFSFCTIDYENYRNNMSPIIKSRTSASKYYISQSIVCFIASTLVTVIPLTFGFVYNLLFLNHSMNSFNGNRLYVWLFQNSSKLYVNEMSNPYTMIFPKLFFEHPTVYVLLYILFIGVFFGLCGIFCYSISLKINKSSVLASLPLEIIFIFGLIQKNSFENNGRRFMINLNIIDYFTINSAPGKDLIFITLFIVAITIISIFLIYTQVSRDQFER